MMPDQALKRIDDKIADVLQAEVSRADGYGRTKRELPGGQHRIVHEFHFAGGGTNVGARVTVEAYWEDDEK